MKIVVKYCAGAYRADQRKPRVCGGPSGGIAHEAGYLDTKREGAPKAPYIGAKRTNAAFAALARAVPKAEPLTDHIFAARIAARASMRHVKVDTVLNLAQARALLAAMPVAASATPRLNARQRRAALRHA